MTRFPLFPARFPQVRRLTPVLGLSMALLLSSCMVGPDFTSPDVPSGAGYAPGTMRTVASTSGVEGGNSQKLVLGADVAGHWWTMFGSPQLNAFVDEAIRNHPNVEAAQYALRGARETALSAGGSLYPQIGTSGAVTRARAGASGATPAYVYSLFNTSVSVSYGLDLFGGTRRQAEARVAAAEFQRFQLEATTLSLTGNLVTTAITEASLKAQIRATEKIISLQRDQLARIEKQFELGAVPNSDVLAQRSNLAQTEASLPTLQKQLAQTRNALLFYLGRMPSEDRGESIEISSLRLPRDLPVSLPSDLVRQRPDIRAAEATLHQASASVGVSVANMLPQITLSGQYGGAAASLASVLAPDQIAWSVAASVTQKLFDGGSLFHSKEAAVAAYEQNLALYKNTVISAFQNTSDALHAIQYDAKALQAQTAAERAASASLKMAQSQYDAGAVNYTAVLNALQTYQNAVILRVQAQAARYTDTVALYQALGGGWWNRNDETEKSLPRTGRSYFAGPDQTGSRVASSRTSVKKDL
ncbi:efflux transporter outer membrane subunit [Rhizobium sp. L1K21]|uniref:efflux transporter outer membrane subunit n=1 Tax=Rhizobium sp. L1K21 TaxID=2954933 RepID=UPI002092B8E2|nr:efflux transporter outer membrane subunit [Rhizobium sp. L1K21]MCO6188444.1 efflux transporter outer membrane subunit [Rhizobium sp. L1K21]